MSKQGNASFQQNLLDIREDKIAGRLPKRFQDEFYALDLLKVNVIPHNSSQLDIWMNNPLGLDLDDYAGPSIYMYAVERAGIRIRIVYW